MDIITLKTICKLRHLSQSEMARMAGISRQAVSLWIKKGESLGSINVESQNLQKIAAALHLSMDTLTKPFPQLSDSTVEKKLRAALLWDYAYKDILDFFIALHHHKPHAMARLVEVYGLFESAHALGNIIWKTFPQYKKYIPPVRRKQCEQIWNLLSSQTLH